MSGDREDLNRIRNTLLQSLRKLDEQIGSTSFIEVHPISTPGRDLPMALLADVADVLHVHGVQLGDAGKQDPKVWSALLMALGTVVEAVPVEFGGRAS